MTSYVRCKICDWNETNYIFNDWHCLRCEKEIRKAIGELNEDDLTNIVLDDEWDSGSTPLYPTSNPTRTVD